MRAVDPASLAAVRAAYDAVAPAYAEKFLRELDAKPLDRALLAWFAEMVRGMGPVAELGCGCGHVARYVHERGVEVFGVDLSERSVALALETHGDRGIRFRQGNFLALDLPDAALAGAIAFYAHVHLPTGELPAAFREIARVLRPGAPALVALHLGEERLHVEEFLGSKVDVDWHMHPMAEITAALEGAGLAVEVKIERAPYPEEYRSHRGYVLARKRAG